MANGSTSTKTQHHHLNITWFCTFQKHTVTSFVAGVHWFLYCLYYMPNICYHAAWTESQVTHGLWPTSGNLMRLQQIWNKIVSKHTSGKDYQKSLATHTKPRVGLNRRPENGRTKIGPEGVFLSRPDALAWRRMGRDSFFLVSPHHLLGHTALLHCRWLNTRPSGPKINDQLPAV